MGDTLSEDDIFDHPDLRDPAWDKLLKQELRQDRRRGFWRRNRLRTLVWLGLIIVVPVVTVYAMVPNAGPAMTPESPAPQPSTTQTTVLPTTPATR